MHPSFVCLSVTLSLNHWTEFNQTCFVTFPHGKGVLEQHYFSVRPSFRVSVGRPSRYILKQLGGIQLHLLHHFPSWEGCVRATLFFCVSVYPSSIHLSVTLLPTPWTEFNQTCYITFPRGKGVPEQHYFSIRPSICPSGYLLLNHWFEFHQTCYISFLSR